MRARPACRNCRTPILALTAAVTGGVCVRCAGKWRHATKHSAVLADQSAWSDASKRSRSYEPDATIHYFDEFYWCERCDAPSVFTAIQQKHAYEVEKRYLFQTRKLCDGCHALSKASQRASDTSV